MPRTWTPEQREKQAELIHNWQPWTHSTGAKTEDGKFNSSMNAWKGGKREEQRARNRECKAILTMSKLLLELRIHGFTPELVARYNALARQIDGCPIIDF